MSRKLTWLDREDDLPDEAPLADQDERVMLRVPIGHREVQRVTIPRLAPPPQQDDAEQSSDEAGRAEPQGHNHEDAGDARPAWPAPREELEKLVRQGLSNSEIAAIYGVRRSTVQSRLQYLGIRRDGETWARLKSRGGQKGAAKTSQVYRELVGSSRQDGDDRAKPETTAPKAAAIEEFARYLAGAILQAQQMGLDVEVRLRAGVRRDG